MSSVSSQVVVDGELMEYELRPATQFGGGMFGQTERPTKNQCFRVMIFLGPGRKTCAS